ncbi:MAG TPA: hypothetical protein VMT60_04195 [Candidatus Bathyarchaeia archaeon]|nr:hypothetical protein [Candidatus Bathyarchaeia archaeon]
MNEKCSNGSRGASALTEARLSKWICVLLLTVFAVAVSSPLSAAESSFFIRVGAGASTPSLKNLNAELERQGNKDVRTGYSFAVSLGRYFGGRAWSLEAHFSAMFYPNFDYTIKSDSLHSFPGKLKHFDYLLIAHRYLWPSGKLFKPSIGAGIGYGTAELLTGGGKIGAAEALLTGKIESEIRSNIDLSLECAYYTGLAQKTFGNPFLLNVDTDYVVDSSGKPLRDTFRSLDVRLGITVRLKQMGPQ